MPAFYLSNIEMKNEDSWGDFLEELLFSQEVCSQASIYYFFMAAYEEREIEVGLEFAIYSVFQKYCNKFSFRIGKISYSETREPTVQEEFERKLMELVVRSREFGGYKCDGRVYDRKQQNCREWSIVSYWSNKEDEEKYNKLVAEYTAYIVDNGKTMSQEMIDLCNGLDPEEE